MAISLTGTLITGVPGATSAESIGRAAATAIIDILPTNSSLHPASLEVEKLAAGIGKINALPNTGHPQTHDKLLDAHQKAPSLLGEE